MPSFKGQRNTISRSSRSLAAPVLQGSDSKNIRPVRRQGRQTEQFLSNLASFAGRKAIEDGQEKADQFKDDMDTSVSKFEATGEVDQELLDDQEYYRHRINTSSGNADGLNHRVSMLKAAKEDQVRAERVGEEWDGELFAKQYSEEVMTGNPAFEDNQYAQAFHAQVEAGTLTLKGQALGINAAATENQAMEATQGFIFATARGGVFDPAMAKNFAEENGLGRHDTDKAIVSAIASFMGQAESLDDLKAYDSLMDSFSDAQKVQFGSALKKLHTAATNRLTGKDAERTSEQMIRRSKTIAGFNVGARNGILDIGDLDKALEDEVIKEADHVSILGTYTKSLEDYAKGAEEAVKFQKVIANPAEYSNLIPADQTKFKNHFEDQHKAASQSLASIAQQISNLQSSGDTEGLDAARTQFSQEIAAFEPLIDQAQAYGFTPRFLTNYFSNQQSPSHPGFRAAAEMYGTLRDVYGSKILTGMNSAAVSKFDMYDKLTKTYGLGDQEARDRINERAEVDPQRLMSHFKGAVGDDLKKTVEDLTKNVEFKKGFLNDTEVDIRNAGVAADAIYELAALNYHVTGDIEDSLKNATDLFKANHQIVDGAWMPSQTLPKDFGLEWDGNKEKIVTALRKKALLGEDEEIFLVPNAATDSTGKMLVVKSDGFTVLTDVQDKPLYVNPAVYMSIFLGQKDKDRKQKGADDLDMTVTIDTAIRNREAASSYIGRS